MMRRAYGFEGHYKSIPQQSLGGKIKTLGKDDVLAQAQKKRKDREQRRLEELSALRIQSVYRKFRLKDNQMKIFRKRFTELLAEVQTCKEVDDIKFDMLLRCLVFSYQLTSSISKNNLVEFCKLAIRSPKSVSAVLERNPSRIVTIAKWLTYGCQLLECETRQASASSSVLLRTLEIFLNPNFPLLSNVDEKQSDSLLYTTGRVSTGGYFKAMVGLCANRIPDSLEYSSTPPTPLSQSILGLILQPLSMSQDSSSIHAKTIVKKFCESFMLSSNCVQIQKYILPALACSQELPLVTLIKAIAENSSLRTVSVLHWLLSLVGNQIGNLSGSEKRLYLSLVSDLFSSLPAYSQTSEDDMEVDVEPEESKTSTILGILNSNSHVNSILGLINDPLSDEGETIHVVCQLCYGLLFKLRKTVHSQRLLYTLAFNSGFLKRLFTECMSISERNATRSKVSLMQVLSRGLNDSLYKSVQQSVHKLKPLLATFTSLYHHCILTLHDDDFSNKASSHSSNPFSVHELVSMISALRDVCLGIVHFALPETRPVFEERQSFLASIGLPSVETVSKEEYQKERQEWVYLFRVTARLTKQLYSRDTYLHFCPDGHWISNAVKIQANDLGAIYANAAEAFDANPLTEEVDDEDSLTRQLSTPDARRLVVLMELPFVIPFEERVQILHTLIRMDKSQVQDGFAGMAPNSRTVINVNIRRDYLYEDAFDKLSPENEPTVTPRFVVMMRNAAGLNEMGIDGGGVFREFLAELLKTGFDPNRGIFSSTEDRQLYPNPEAPNILEKFQDHFFFLGRMLGKALYEDMLVELPLADFFLSKILGKTESDLHQLSSLDSDLYRNLLSMKSYEGDVVDLGVDFSLTTSALGTTKQVELKPNGANIAVDDSNKIEYVHLVADYKLNTQIRAQCKAFRAGIADVIRLDWLQMFDFRELRVLISGSSIPIDVEDLRNNTVYSGAYTDDHKTVEMFWNIVRTFSNERRSKLLKFVTSCSRAPLLGFKELHPKFCIHHGGTEIRLPTASTCMNFLKLPEFKNEETLREKLLYAIESEAGFELS